MHGGCLSPVARPRAVHWLRAETELPSKGYFRALATGVDHPPARGLGPASFQRREVSMSHGFNKHPCRHASARICRHASARHDVSVR